MEQKVFSRDFAGQKLTVTFSKLAERADASCMIQYGDTSALVTLVMGKEDRPGIDFFPLTVEYQEKYYAAGKIYGSRYVRRETRPSENAILTGRLIDRTIRPLFNQNMRREVQIVVTILSIDQKNDPDFIGLLGASLVASLSAVPFSGPVAGIRVGRKDGTNMVLPSYEDRDAMEADLFIGGTKQKINMIELGAKEAKEADVAAMHDLAFQNVKDLIAWQEEIIAKMPRAEKFVPAAPQLDPAVEQFIATTIKAQLEKELFISVHREGEVESQSVKDALDAFLKEKALETQSMAAAMRIDELINDLVHEYAVERSLRVDGRALDQIRPLDMAVGTVPRTHGSALFLRGMTHALSIATLGGPGDFLFIQGMEVNEERRFMHHYNFNPYSTGETGSFRGPGRREIGHGALAEKAVAPMIPAKDQFPYTIRVVTEILSSNGSTSQASVCGTSLALMDAGVPIARHVAGISIGLMTGKNGSYKLLTDIQGPEDHHGDMDFKVAGTRMGITAIQMDVKVEGITLDILREALERARAARAQILDKMEQLIPAPRTELSAYAPRIMTMQVPKEKIGEVIGSGGKTIRSISEKTGALVDIEEDGTVYVTAETKDSAEKAIAMITSLTKEYTVGEIVQGTVTKILDFGAVVEIDPNHEGLVHISELAPQRIEKVEDIVHVGQTIQVKVIEVSPDGRIRLSLKQVANPELTSAPRLERRPRFGSGPRRDTDRGSRGPRRPRE